jgi:hypothetical protein
MLGPRRHSQAKNNISPRAKTTASLIDTLSITQLKIVHQANTAILASSPSACGEANLALLTQADWYQLHPESPRT